MFGGARVRRPAIRLLMLPMLMSGCASVVGSETTRATCDELRRALPTWSAQDTPQSRIEGAAFIDVFDAVCGG
jgi:uncharacterized protein YceK